MRHERTNQPAVSADGTGRPGWQPLAAGILAAGRPAGGRRIRQDRTPAQPASGLAPRT